MMITPTVMMSSVISDLEHQLDTCLEVQKTIETSSKMNHRRLCVYQYQKGHEDATRYALNLLYREVGK